nr:fibulin-1-like [Loxodonta africana]
MNELRQEKTDTVRCVKSCRPNDVTCVLNPVHTISHTVISLPTFREFTRPGGHQAHAVLLKGVFRGAGPMLCCPGDISGRPTHAVLLVTEIIFLRAITPAYPANHADIIFDITEGNLRDSFDIIKRYMDGMTVGVVRQVRPIVGPFHAVLKLEMNYLVGGVISHRNIVNVHIFVSEYWF